VLTESIAQPHKPVHHDLLPASDNEWYKAAYYDGTSATYYDYPTGSDSATPVASGTAAGTAVYGQLEAQGPAEIFQAEG